MPLYALDGHGRLYQTGGFSEKDMSVGRYADYDLGEQDNLYFGDLSNREAQRMAAHRAKKMRAWKKRQAQMKAERMKAARKARAVQLQKIAAQKKLAAYKTRSRQRQQQKYLQAMRDSQNPMGVIESQLMGDPMMGFQYEGEAITSPHQMASLPLADDVYYGEDYGDNMSMEGLRKRLKRAVKKVQSVASKAIAVANPISITSKIAKEVPLVKDAYKGIDKISGGLLTSVENVSKLPQKAVAGKKISKAEFMEAAMLALKAGAIVATGGSAVAAISAAAGQLKGGPLGKTSLGRSLLSVAEIGSVSAVGGQSLSKVLEKKAQDMITAKASSEVGKRAGVLGSIAAGAAVSAGFEGVKAPQGGVIKADAGVVNTVSKNSDKVAATASKGLLDKVKSGELKFDSQAALQKAQNEVVDKAKKEVAKEFEKKTGIPLDIAQRAVKGDIPTQAELEMKVKAKIAGGLDEAKADLVKIKDQITNSDATMKTILEKKQEILDREIKKKDLVVSQIKEKSAEELVGFNKNLISKIQAANAQRDVSAKLAAELKNLTDQFERAGTTNVDLKNKLWPQIEKLKAQLLIENMKFDKMADEAWTLSDQSKELEDLAALRVLQAEVAPESPKVAHNYHHPLLAFGA